jgi:hypothetical protein
MNSKFRMTLWTGTGYAINADEYSGQGGVGVEMSSAYKYFHLARRHKRYACGTGKFVRE